MFRVALLDPWMMSFLIPRLQEQSTYLGQLPASPIALLMYSAGALYGLWVKETLPLVELLLKLGYDPNERCQEHYALSRRIPNILMGVTPWKTVLLYGRALVDTTHGRSLISLYLRFGADPNALIDSDYRGRFRGALEKG